MARNEKRRRSRKPAGRTGRLRARRTESARRGVESARGAVEAEHVAEVRRRIQEALEEGRKLRAQIEARIDRVLAERSRQQGRRARR